MAVAPQADEALPRDEAGWRERLDPEQFRVLRQRGTEGAFTGAYWNHHAAGTYHCAGCGAPLFRSSDQFDSGTGWPSFSAALPGALSEHPDHSLGMCRSELRCARCGGHQGHLFPDGPAPQGLRHCINSVSLRFVAANEDGAKLPSG